MIERVCGHCGNTYATYPSVRKQFCGHACASAAKMRGDTARCGVCSAEFYRPPSRSDQIHCSKSCARTASNLTAANPALTRDIRGEKNPMFGRGMSGAENPMFGRRKEECPRWNGGIKTRTDGYILAVAPDNHPYPSDITSSGTKYVLLHRLIMEARLGRFLEPGEVVHHRDGDPSNNDPSNLELFASQADHIRIGHGRVD